MRTAAIEDAENIRRAAAQADRNAQLVKLKLASPKRAAAPQHDVDGLALFDTARQPSLF